MSKRNERNSSRNIYIYYNFYYVIAYRKKKSLFLFFVRIFFNINHLIVFFSGRSNRPVEIINVFVICEQFGVSIFFSFLLTGTESLGICSISMCLFNSEKRSTEKKWEEEGKKKVNFFPRRWFSLFDVSQWWV
jgi:hypothetical protein